MCDISDRLCIALICTVRVRYILQPRAVDTEAVVLASISILTRLVEVLEANGTLKPSKVDAIFSGSFDEQQNATAAPIQRAAYVIHFLHTKNGKARPFHL